MTEPRDRETLLDELAREWDRLDGLDKAWLITDRRFTALYFAAARAVRSHQHRQRSIAAARREAAAAVPRLLRRKWFR